MTLRLMKGDVTDDEDEVARMIKGGNEWLYTTCHRTGLTPTRVAEEVAAGRILAVKVGRDTRPLILSVDKWCRENLVREPAGGEDS